MSTRRRLNSFWLPAEISFTWFLDDSEQQRIQRVDQISSRVHFSQTCDLRKWCLGQSQSHITTDGLSVSMSYALVKVKVTLRLTVGQSACLMPRSKSKSHYDWRSVSQHVLVSSLLWDLWPDFFFQICCLVSVVRPLWREAGSVFCQSFVNTVYSSQSVFTFSIVRHSSVMYNIYRASFSPDSVQQIMP
jgi:hypothetical protein